MDLQHYEEQQPMDNPKKPWQELIRLIIDCSEVYTFGTSNYQPISFNIHGVLCFNNTGMWHPDDEQLNRYKRVELHDIIRKLTSAGLVPLIKSWTKFSIYNCKFLEYLDELGILDKITFLAYSDPITCIPAKYMSKMTSLQTLIINTSYTFTYDVLIVDITGVYASNLAEIISILPASLETLFIQSADFNGKLDNLPIGLRILYIISTLFNQPLDYLPTGLEVLAVLNAHYYTKSHILNLPQFLKFLALDINNHSTDNTIALQIPLEVEYLYLSSNRKFPESFIDSIGGHNYTNLQQVKRIICSPYWFQIFNSKPGIKLISIDTVHISDIIEKLLKI